MLGANAGQPDLVSSTGGTSLFNEHLPVDQRDEAGMTSLASELAAFKRETGGDDRVLSEAADGLSEWDMYSGDFDVLSTSMSSNGSSRSNQGSMSSSYSSAPARAPGNTGTSDHSPISRGADSLSQRQLLTGDLLSAVLM